MSDVNEWGDPHTILKEDKEPSKEEQKRAAIEQAIANAYGEQHTTTPLDTGGWFKLQTLDRFTVGETEQYRFRVKRFLGIQPAGTYTGTVQRNGEEWVVEYEKRPRVVKRVQSRAGSMFAFYRP
jgi:hypothetical protein